MSDEIKKDDSVVAEAASKQSAEEKAEYVSKKAYEEVRADMHKNKSKAKELEAALNEYQVKLKQIEEEKMAEQQQWKELFEKRSAELEAERQKTAETKNSYLRSVKLSALKQQLGGNIKDAYLSFANLNGIEFKEDGSVDSESLLAVANQFRKEHGELIPSTENTNITGHAGKSDASLGSTANTKTMSSQEL
jgi:thioester reductase-like protein